MVLKANLKSTIFFSLVQDKICRRFLMSANEIPNLTNSVPKSGQLVESSGETVEVVG
jgi:hypothetical protein